MMDKSLLLLVEPITHREQEVLDELAKGASNKDIGVTLWITEKTVRAHLQNIYEKLDVTNRTEAVIEAQALGLVPSGGELHPVAVVMAMLERIRPGSWAEAATVLAGEGNR